MTKEAIEAIAIMAAVNNFGPYGKENIWPAMKKPSPKEICDDCKYRYKECLKYCRKQKKKTATEETDMIIVECAGYSKEEPTTEEDRGETT